MYGESIIRSGHNSIEGLWVENPKRADAGISPAAEARPKELNVNQDSIVTRSCRSCAELLAGAGVPDGNWCSVLSISMSV